MKILRKAVWLAAFALVAVPLYLLVELLHRLTHPLRCLMVVIIIKAAEQFPVTFQPLLSMVRNIGWRDVR